MDPNDIHPVIADLSPRYRLVWDRRQEGATFRVIGEEIGVSISRAAMMYGIVERRIQRYGHYGTLSVRAQNVMVRAVMIWFGGHLCDERRARGEPAFTKEDVVEIRRRTRLLNLRQCGKKTRKELLAWADIEE